MTVAVATRCCMESVQLTDVSAFRAALISDCFAENEQVDAGTLPDRSLAGRVAVKRAVCRLLQDTARLSPQDVRVEKAPDGTPKVVALGQTKHPLTLRAADIFVSISHSRNVAVGLAAVGPAAVGPAAVGPAEVNRRGAE